MSGLVVGGVTIPVASGGINRDRTDLIDRARALDGTYRASSTGTAKRSWKFTTTPLSRQVADYYEGRLGIVTAQTCSGDILGGGANDVTYSEDFDNVIWTKTNLAGLASGIDDPMGGTSAFRLTASAANGQMEQILTDGSSLVRTASLWLRRSSGTGTIAILRPDAGAYTTVVPTADWTRFSVTGIAGVSRYANVKIVTSGDAIDAFGFQVETGSTETTYQTTTTAAVSTLSPSCFTDIMGWTPVPRPGDHYVQISFALHEA